MDKSYINHILTLLLFIIYPTASHGQKGKLLIYATDNYYGIFLFDLSNNRYCFSFGSDELVGSPIFSYGSLTKNGNTIVVRSDYDNTKLPIKVQCEKKNEIEGSVMCISIFRNDTNLLNKKAFEIEKKKYLHAVINDKDTIQFENDTIHYSQEINKFYFLSYNAEIMYLYYKTQEYYNSTSCNCFNILFDSKVEYSFYKYLNDTITITKSKAVWWRAVGKANVYLKKRSFNKIRGVLNNCECLDKSGEMKFSHMLNHPK